MSEHTVPKRLSTLQQMVTAIEVAELELIQMRTELEMLRPYWGYGKTKEQAIAAFKAAVRADEAVAMHERIYDRKWREIKGDAETTAC
jgi:hypothetical protein